MNEKRAIEVLKNEIRCIDRRAKGKCNGGSDCQTCGLVLPDTEIISALTSAIEKLSERQRHGKWILEKDPNGIPYCFHCSICDNDFHHIDIKCAYDYCPNCGARMDGEDEE